MRRYLVVGHRTLGGAHLMEHLHALREADPYCRFHVVVPRYHPKDHPWTDFEVDNAAQLSLDEMLDRMAAMGIGATGELGDANPIYAIDAAIRHAGTDSFCELVLSTLPRRASLWWDVPHRVERAFPKLAVTHLVAHESLVGA